MGYRVCLFISSDKSFEINDISEGSFRWFLFKEFSSRFASNIKIDEVILRWVCSDMRLAPKGAETFIEDELGLKRGIYSEFIITSTLMGDFFE